MSIRSLAVTAATFLIFSAAHAAADESLRSAILSCSAQQDEKAQLACYNQIAAQLKAGATLAAQSPAAIPTVAAPQVAAHPPDAAPAPPPQVAAQPPAAPSGEQEGRSWYNVGSLFGSSETPPPSRPVVGTPADFGKANMPFQADAPAELDHITAGVANVTYNFYHTFRVTLDNGQVWRQVDEDTKIARFKNDKTEVVTISRGFLDSFHLAIQGVWGTFTVKRIK
jgi:hypothetical protein